MNIISLVFNEVLYRPLFNGLIFLYNTISFQDFGVAIILLTLLIRFAIFPLNQKAIRSQKALNVFQPQIKEIQQKFKDDRQKQGQALMEFYQKNKINPAGGCLPLLLQLPILLALYQVLWNGLNPERLNTLYSFVSRPEVINPMFLGFMNLSKSNPWMAVLAGILTFFQSKMMISKKSLKGQPGDFSVMMNKQMLYFMPLMTIFIAWNLPAGLALYWVVMTLFGIGQQYFVLRKKDE